MSIRNFACAGMIALASAAAFPANAQNGGLSTEEIQQRFEKQQKTRGLVIAPAAGVAEQAPETGNAATTTVSADDGYVPVSDDNQINISISFDFDSAALRADQKPKLASLCEAMRNVSVGVFQIVGHTDASGSAEYNRRLSELRAEEVKRYLVNDCGIQSERLRAVGVGEQYPYNKANPRADENRRVEFQAIG